MCTCLEGDGVARWYLEPDRPLGARFRGEALVVYGDLVDPTGETSVESDLSDQKALSGCFSPYCPRLAPAPRAEHAREDLAGAGAAGAAAIAAGAAAVAAVAAGGGVARLAGGAAAAPACCRT